MDEGEKVRMFERSVAAWNRGDLEAVLADSDPDFEWDLTRSDIPGETGIYRGREEYLGFARGWREMLGPTQLEIEEAFELDDGRLFVLLLQAGTGTRSGADVDLHYVQILSFDAGKFKRCEVFTDRRKALAAAGLDTWPEPTT